MAAHELYLLPNGVLSLPRSRAIYGDLSDERLLTPVYSVLVRTDDGDVLYDTGIDPDAAYDPKALEASRAASTPSPRRTTSAAASATPARPRTRSGRSSCRTSTTTTSAACATSGTRRSTCRTTSTGRGCTRTWGWTASSASSTSTTRSTSRPSWATARSCPASGRYRRTATRPDTRATGPTRTSVNLSWNTVSNATAYRVEYRRDGSIASWTVRSETTNLRDTVTGLTCNIAYNFRVKAKGNGTTYSEEFGDASAAKKATTSSCPNAPAPTNLRVTGTTAASISVAWNRVTDAARYRLEYRRGTTGTWTTEPETASLSDTVSRLDPNTSYSFRVRARGDGSPYSTTFGNPSGSTSGTTVTGNRAPVFSTDPYAFSVSEDASTGTTVGTVTATDQDNDTLAYSITAGNTGSKFAIGSTTGVITVAGALDRSAAASYSLTVRASDSRLNDTTTVNITVSALTPVTPSHPRNFVVQPAVGGFTATWSRPTTGTVTTYELQFKRTTSEWPSDDNVIQVNGSSHAVTGLTDVKISYDVRIRACNTTCSGWLIASAVSPLAKLATPMDLTITPLPLRRARLTWTGDTNASSYRVQVRKTGKKTWESANVLGWNNADTNAVIELDRLYGAPGVANISQAKSYDYEIIARPDPNGASTTYVDSDAAYVRLIDNPILTSGSANGHSAGSEGQALLQWQSIPHVSEYRIVSRELGQASTGFDHTHEDWVGDNSWPYYQTPVSHASSLVQTSGTVAEARLTPLATGRIYAVQVNYTLNSGRSVFSARDAYVWPSSGAPSKGLRVATYPSFGHWGNREVYYTICENTFPPRNKGDWSDVIESAFEAWEFADTQVLSRPRWIVNISRPTIESRCDTTPYGLVTSQYNNINEVIMAGVIDYKDFQGEARLLIGSLAVQSFFGLPGGPGVGSSLLPGCVFLPGTGACVISPEYTVKGGPAAQTDLSTVPGSVDMLIKGEGKDHADERVLIPTSSDLKANDCDSEYRLILHEAGHFLGLSGYSPFDSFTPGYASYIASHPGVPDSVLNYDNRVPFFKVSEYDCVPYPLDIMAIFALYQDKGVTP